MKKLVLIDLDETIIDLKYNLTVPKAEHLLSQLAEKCMESRIEIGLASDTALTDLQIWQKSFGFTGPILAEFGAVVQTSNGEVHILSHNRSCSYFRENLIGRLVSKRPAINVISSDNTTLIRNFFHKRKCPISFVNPRVILMNSARINTMSFYAKFYNKESGCLDYSPDFFQEAMATLSDLILEERISYPLSPRPQIEINPDYGICIVRPEGTCKKQGVQLIAKKESYDPQIIMIGNSMGDFTNLPNVIHYGVANATPEYKQHCTRVANKPLTAGVLELLESLLES